MAILQVLLLDMLTDLTPEKRKKIMMKVKLDKQKEAEMKFNEVLNLITDLKTQMIREIEEGYYQKPEV